MELKFYGVTDVGNKRQKNEDDLWPPQGAGQHIYRGHPRGQLFVIADGMGGYGAGNVASEIAVNTIQAEYYAETTPGQTPHNWLKAAIEAAHQKIAAESKTSETHSRMGTTVVAAVIREDQLWTAWVGDSRVYLQRDGRLEQLTEDHAVLWEQYKNGLIKWEELHYHPHRSKLNNSLTARRAQVTPDFGGPRPLRDGDQILLCSDGLSSEVHHSQIETILRDYPLRQAAQALVEAAKSPKTWLREGEPTPSAGGEDNITVIIIHTPGVEPVHAMAPPAAAKPAAAAGGGLKWVAVAAIGLLLLVLAVLAGIFLMAGDQPPAQTVAVSDPALGEPSPGAADVALGQAQPTATLPPSSDGQPAAAVEPSPTLAPGETPRPTSTLARVDAPTPVTPTATPLPLVATATPTPTAIVPLPAVAAQKQLVFPEDQHVFPFGTNRITFEWQFGDDCDLPANLGFEIRIWKEGGVPLGAMSAVEEQDKVVCNDGAYSFTVGDVQSTPGVKGAATGKFNWDVLLVRIDPYEPVARNQDTVYAFVLGEKGGGGGGDGGGGDGGGGSSGGGID